MCEYEKDETRSTYERCNVTYVGKEEQQNGKEVMKVAGKKREKRNRGIRGKARESKAQSQKKVPWALHNHTL